MEIEINDAFFDLKPMNSRRRTFFAENVLPFFPPENTSEAQHQKNIQAELVRTHQKTFSDFSFHFFKSFDDAIKLSMWMFLSVDAKNQIKSPEKIDCEKDQKTAFLNWCFSKITAYSKYVANACASQGAGEKEQIEAIFAFLAKTYGWSFEEMREMDELDLFKSIEQAVLLKQQENLEKINAGALTAAYASGSKQAKSQIDNLNRRADLKRWISKERQINPGLKPKISLSVEEIMHSMQPQKKSEVNNG